jgi:sulfonate transport system ATP-binding protein
LTAAARAGLARSGFTAILVTHDVAEAVALADRVLVIEDGRIAEDFSVDSASKAARFGRTGGAGRCDPENLLEGTEDTSDL